MLGDFPRREREFERAIDGKPAPGESATAAIVKLASGRTEILAPSLLLNGKLLQGQSLLAAGDEARSGLRKSTVMFEFDRLVFPGSQGHAGEAKLVVEGKFLGAGPSEASAIWLGPEGAQFVPDAIAGGADPLAGETVFSLASVPAIFEWLEEAFERQMGSRLRLLARESQESIRRGAAFFYELDMLTHPDMLADERKELQAKLREALFQQSLVRAHRGYDRPTYEDDDEALLYFADATSPYRTLFKSLLRSHFRCSTTAFGAIEPKLVFDAVSGFVLGEQPHSSQAGLPDSPYFFCFAELIAFFGQGEGTTGMEERRFWLPVLEAFVVCSRAFVELSRRNGVRTFDSYVAAQIPISRRDDAKLASVSAALESAFANSLTLSPAPMSDGEVTALWMALLEEHVGIVKEALAKDIAPE